MPICPVCNLNCIVIRQGRAICNQCGYPDQIVMMTVWQRIPVYIINRNNLDRGFRDLVNWLVMAGVQNIEVLDNASTYPPLLKYYEECPAKITKLDVNGGPWVFWNTNRHLEQEIPYVVTDPDVVPDKDCPSDLISKLLEVFRRYPGCRKVGPGIRIDNLPDCYDKKNDVVTRESPHFDTPAGADVFKSAIDTTFALYEAKSAFPAPGSVWDHHYRLATPYVVEHRPWYVDSSNLSEEDIYYKANAQNGWSNWR